MFKILMPLLMGFLISLSSHVWAANYSDPVEGIFKGIYGDSLTVEVPSLTTKSPVTNQDQNGDLSFQLNAETGYRNFNQLTDLKVGDPVRVEYSQDPTSKSKGMIATIITKMEPEVVTAVPVNTVSTDTPEPTVTQTVTTTTTRVDTQ